MENFKTPMAMENEIFKATDFNFGYDSVIFNVAMAMKLILSGSKVDYVIGGSVTPYSSGGLNVSIAPLYALCNSTGVCVVEGDITEPVSFEEADSELDRIDIIEVCGTEVGYDSQLRKFIDPLSGVETTQTINTKKKIALSVTVKKGLNGSEVAPEVDSSYIKLAEVRIPAGTNDITNDMIRNIDAKKSGASNSGWTANKSATFNPGYITEVFQTFLTDHNEDGSHKNAVIDAEDINFGTETKQVKGTVIPTGQSMNIHEESYTSSKSITDLILALASNVNSLYGYSNDVLSRFSWIADVPVAASTGSVDIATGGEKTIDGVSCKIGQIVFLKNQENAIENGLYKVQAGAWSRHTGYTAGTNAFAHKFIFVPAGTQNKGKIFFINVDTAIVGTHELNFRESVLSPYALGNSLVTRDSAGRAQFATPVSAKDAANKEYVDSKTSGDAGEVQANLDNHINNKSNPHGVSLTQLGVTATKEELNKLDGFTGSASKLNFTNGLTSDAQTQLNAKATTASLNSHTGATTGVHGAVSTATANKIAIRDSAGRLQVATPSANADATNKQYVESLFNHGGSTDGRNLLNVLGVSSVAQAMAKLSQKCNGEGVADFSGLLIGDYLDLPSLEVGSTTYTWNPSYQNLRIVISGFNQYKGCGSTENKKNHILWTFKNVVLEGQMNSRNINTGGYNESAMKTFLDGEFKTGLATALGSSSYLYTIQRRISIKDSTSWTTNTVFLPTEVEVFGVSTYGDDQNASNTNIQYPIYRDSSCYRCKKYNGSRYFWWEATPHASNSTGFCIVSYDGISLNYSASISNGGVAPAWGCPRSF